MQKKETPFALCACVPPAPLMRSHEFARWLGMENELALVLQWMFGGELPTHRIGDVTFINVALLMKQLLEQGE
ncbi:DNA-binding protein [Pseudomonas nicosulfuronedens]